MSATMRWVATGFGGSLGSSAFGHLVEGGPDWPAFLVLTLFGAGLLFASFPWKDA